MHNAKQDLDEIFQMVQAGIKYPGHDRFRMSGIDRAVYWFTTSIIYGAFIGLVYFLIRVFI